MTKQAFMQFCEEYYREKYEGAAFFVMDEYLDKKSEQFLDAALMVLAKRFSRTNRMAPGPAEIEKHLDEIVDSIPKPPPEPRESITDEERKEMGRKLLWLSNELKSRSGLTGKSRK